MEVWVPPINRVKENQFIKMNLWDEEYWYLYGNETDPKVREQLLYTYDNPLKENDDRRMLQTDNGLKGKSEIRNLEPDKGYGRRKLQNFDTLNIRSSVIAQTK